MFGKKKDTDSLFDATVVARLKLLETASRGAIRLPKGNFLKAAISKTPENPTLQVIALKRNERDTVIYGGMGIPGEKELRTTDFTIKGVLTAENASATGESIAKLLGDPTMAESCGEQLVRLTRKEIGTKTVFYIDQRQQLAITEGKED